MLCSQCSRIVKPIMAVDIDGTLGDYHGHFLEFSAAYFDMEKPEGYIGDAPFRVWWTAMTGKTDKDWHDVKLAYRQGGMKRTMPAYDYAWNLCYEIQKNGCELWVTTTRPYLSLDNIIPDTVWWCNIHEIEYSGMLFDEDKYEQLAQRVNPDRVCAVIDDLPEMCEAADLVFEREVAILIANPYNTAHNDRFEIGEVIADVEFLAEQWYSKHS